MSCTVFIVRHGEYVKQKYGDGPLSDNGREQIEATADEIADKHFLPPRATVHRDDGIDLALVSGSLRGMDTFISITEAFGDYRITIQKRIVHADFFNTNEEDSTYQKLYGPNSENIYPGFKTDVKKLGSTQAILKHAPHLIRNPAMRVVESVRQAQKDGQKTFLIVTHQGYEQVIVKALTDEDCPMLELGKHMEVEFD